MQTETIVDDPRRPLRGTSHLDSRAGLTGSTSPFLLRPTLLPVRPFRSFPVYVFSRFEMEGKERRADFSPDYIVGIAATEDSPK